MFEQLRNNFRFLRDSTAISAVFIAGICLTPHIANAADISDNQITASTSMPIWNGFTVAQIADGITPGAGGTNGFTTNAKTGTISFDFDQPYDIDGFKLWNDVVVRAEGIKTFRLDFKTTSGDTRSTQIFETTPRQVDVQLFNFPKVEAVTSTDLVILSSLNEPANPPLLKTFAERIEVREIAFTGEATIDQMQDYIDGLMVTIRGHEDRIAELEDLLTKLKNKIGSLEALLQDRDAEIVNLKAEIVELKKGLPKPPSKIQLILGGLALLSLGGLFGILTGRRRKPHPERQPESTPAATAQILPAFLKNLHTPKESSSFDTLKKGMCFAASPMALGGLPAALGVAKPVYDAVGRIGFAQQGKPVGKDESFGTGILVSDRHILTNRHVWEMFKNRLAGDEGTGIEFYGEKKSDKSEFITFDGAEPVCIEGWDAAIFTLTKTPENRAPVSITPRPAEELDDLDIIVVGYPQARRVTEDIAAVTENDPVFGVKRYSEGKIFRHSVDIENPYGVEAAVEQIINSSETLRAICHNASTLGGSSGSAVICKKTGDLIALHFGFDSAYEWKEAANFALAGENLSQSVAEITASVTNITENPKNDT